MQKVKLLMAVVFSGLLLGLGPLPLATAAVDTAESATEAVCDGVGGLSGGDGCEDPAGSSSLSGVVESVVNIISFIVAVVSVIMVMVGGLKYVTSQGDSTGTTNAKNTVLYAIIGLIVVALAQLIVQFTLRRVATPTP